jgi:hypothetical protein
VKKETEYRRQNTECTLSPVESVMVPVIVPRIVWAVAGGVDTAAANEKSRAKRIIRAVSGHVMVVLLWLPRSPAKRHSARSRLTVVDAAYGTSTSSDELIYQLTLGRQYLTKTRERQAL